MERLLVATDLTPRSDDAIERAAMITRMLNARLAIVHVVNAGEPDTAEQQAAEARRVLNERVRAHSTSGPQVVAAIIKGGDPVRELAAVARKWRADLLVLGRHGRRPLADVVAETTAQRLVRAGRTPLLLVNQPVRGPYERVTVAVDRSSGTARALHAARALQLLPPRVRVVHAFQAFGRGKLVDAGLGRQVLQAHADRAAAAASLDLARFLVGLGLEFEYRLLLAQGRPAPVLLAAMAEDRTDLVVSGTRGFGRLTGALLGGVAKELLRRAESDVLVVPHSRSVKSSERAEDRTADPTRLPRREILRVV